MQWPIINYIIEIVILHIFYSDNSLLKITILFISEIHVNQLFSGPVDHLFFGFMMVQISVEILLH